MTDFGISEEDIIETTRSDQWPTDLSDEASKFVSTGPSATDPTIIADGIDVIWVSQKTQSVYTIQYAGYLSGTLRVTAGGIDTFAENHLANEQGIPNWYLTEYTTDSEDLPQWMPDSYSPDQIICCERCATSVPTPEILTPGRTDGDTVDRFCPDCWEDVREHWSPEWLHAGQSDIIRADYLDRTVGSHPDEVDIDELVALTDSHHKKAQMHALTAISRLIPERADDIVLVLPTLTEKLTSDVLLTRFGALHCLALLAEHQPEDVLSVVDDVLPFLDPAADSGIHEVAIRFVAGIAAEYPEQVLDAVPKLPVLLLEDPPEEQKAVQALLDISKAEPQAIAPVTSDLVTYIEHDEGNYRVRALAVLGHLAKESPEEVQSTIPAMIDLLETPNDHLRANAAGLLADVVEQCPEELLYDLSRLITLVDDEDEYVRHNATYVLSKVAKRYPEDARPAIEPLIDALDDDLEETRINACRTLGYIGAQEAIDALEDCRDGDSSMSVQKAAGWALVQIPE